MYLDTENGRPEPATGMRPHTSLPTVYLIALGAFALGMASYVTAGLIPMMTLSFDISIGVAAQLVTAYTLAYGIGSPIIVALWPGNRQRKGLLAALGLFVLANAASALATDFFWLVAFRVLAGMGSGVYLAMGISTAASLSVSARGKAISVIMGGMAAGTVLGVPFGLVLAQNFGWASALWLVTLLGAIAWFGLIRRLPDLPESGGTPIREKLFLLVDGQVTLILMVSLLAAVASLGMYTFLGALITSSAYGGAESATPFLWVWGIGGVLGSFMVGPLAGRITGPRMTLAIMVILTFSLVLLPLMASWSRWLAMAPIFVWGAVGWALQVPQNSQLIHVRESRGDGNLAVALNESALYLGSAIGAAIGGMALSLNLPIWSLPLGAGGVAAVGAAVQFVSVRRGTN